MYTQCPDCSTAFRVTAEILKQAAGKVRCGGCSNAFNALAFLSEEMPLQHAEVPPDVPAPKLLAEPVEDIDDTPKTISAEQSAALLKTLDELAGSDIRIEDTGVEWRVLNEDEVAERDDNDDADACASNGAAQTGDIEAAAANELRFDDDTPLPDDFDLDNLATHEPPAIQDAEAQIASEDFMPEISLGEPGEWTDILGEFNEPEEDIAELHALEIDADDTNVDDGDLPERQAGADFENGYAHDDPELVIEADDAGEVELLEQDEGGDEFELIADDDGADGIELQQEPIVGQHTIADELAALEDLVELDTENLDSENLGSENLGSENDTPPIVHDVPPPSEEEHTRNMMIDQELMALAIEDEDGFASTIIIPQIDAEAALAAGLTDRVADDVPDDSAFEAIIMEGDSARSANDEAPRLDADSAAEIALLTTAGEPDPQTTHNRSGSRIAAGVVALIVLLGLQLVHQSREALATIPAFNNTVGPIYRAFGQPLQPDWDISGWRFEVTKGSTDGENEVATINGSNTVDELLTIYSRIGNESERALPYPLIGISLTDRFEETIGNRILDPVEYLSNDLDPRKLVQPGNSFNAVISIRSPAAEATGFKLNVCYRLTGEQLRCAIDDFK